MEVDDDKIDIIAANLEKIIKPEYYIHFTNYKELVVVFRGRHFRLRINNVVKEDKTGATEFETVPEDLKIWKDAFEYGTNEGKIDPRYMLEVV